MISVVLATKNGEKYMDRAIESVLSQTEKDIELIIVSDESTDQTVAKAQAWSSRDSRVRLIELKENIGPGLARNKGIQEALGEYIALIDDDDYWISPDKLQKQKDFLNNHTDYVFTGTSKTQLVDENEKTIKVYTLPQTDTEIRNSFLLRNNFVTSSVLFRKDIYLQSGGFKNMYLAEDYDLWLRIGLLGKVANISDVSVAYTIRSGSASKKRVLELYQNIKKIVQENKNRYPNAWLGILKANLRIVLFHLKHLS